MPFRYGKLKTKRKKKGITPKINREVKKYKQTLSADLEEEQIVMSPTLTFDVNK